MLCLPMWCRSDGILYYVGDRSLPLPESQEACLQHFTRLCQEQLGQLVPDQRPPTPEIVLTWTGHPTGLYEGRPGDLPEILFQLLHDVRYWILPAYIPHDTPGKPHTEGS